jgi:uncharacterized protein (DUF2235 family)
MRRIVICLDGTWASHNNQVERGDGTEVHKPTNVLKTYRAVLPTETKQGAAQALRQSLVAGGKRIEAPPRMVSTAKQALAIDERRTDFPPEIWKQAHPGQSVE